MSIEYQLFSAFRTTIQQLVAPEDLAENLEAYFRDQVGNALCDIQTLIERYRSFNLRFFRKEDVNEFCAASIFEGPVGKVTQLFAYKPGKDCKKFYYKHASLAEIECWQERQRCVLCNATDPPSHNIYESPYCNYWLDGEEGCGAPYLITAEEDDCRFRSLDDDERIFAVGPDYKIYAAPRFPCGYSLLLQWQGINRKWEDFDLVPVDQMLRGAVNDYVEYRIATKEKDTGMAKFYFDAYTVDIRTLRHRYLDEHDVEFKRDCSAGIEQLMADVHEFYPTPLYPPYLSPAPPAETCPECPEASGPLNSAVYVTSRDSIYAVRGGYVFKFNANGVMQGSSRFLSPEMDDTYIAYDPTTDHLWAIHWRGFALASAGAAGRSQQFLVKINPDTLVSTLYDFDTDITFGPTLFQADEGPRQIVIDAGFAFILAYETNEIRNLYRINLSTLTLTHAYSGVQLGAWGNLLIDGSVVWFCSVEGYNSIDARTLAALGAHSDFVQLNGVSAAGGDRPYGITRNPGGAIYAVQKTQVLLKGTPAAAPALRTTIDLGRANATPVNIRYNAADSQIYIPLLKDDTVAVLNPIDDSFVIKAGFDSPWDVVFTPTKKFAVQHGVLGLKEIV